MFKTIKELWFRFSLLFKYDDIIMTTDFNILNHLSYDYKKRLIIIKDYKINPFFRNDKAILNMLFQKRKINVDIIIVPSNLIYWRQVDLPLREMVSKVFFNNDLSINYLYYTDLLCIDEPKKYFNNKRKWNF